MLNNQAGQTALDQLSTFTHGPDNGAIYDVWKQHYKAITLANIAIERIPPIVMDETLKARLVNEAKFLRALLYFDMVRMFGRIPLLLNEVESVTPEVSEVEDVYAQIINDLTDAENLPAEQADGRGRATQGAAKALLAKVYLTQKNYTKTVEKTQEVIDMGLYSLWEDFRDIYKIQNRGHEGGNFFRGIRGCVEGKLHFGRCRNFT